MEFAYAIWNFLWENQLYVAFAIVLILWLAIRGFDMFRWLFGKKKAKAKEEKAGEDASDSSS